MPAIPDSLLYFDCTPVEKARSKRNYARIEAAIALLVGTVGSVVIVFTANPWFVCLFGGFNLFWAAGKFWEAREQEKLLDMELIREVMEM